MTRVGRDAVGASSATRPRPRSSSRSSIGIAMRAKASPSRLLLPARLRVDPHEPGHADQHVDEHRRQRTDDATTASTPMGMFELAPVGIPIAVVGLALHADRSGERLIPDAREPRADRGLRPAGLPDRGAGPADSRSPGRRSPRAGSGADLDLTVLRHRPRGESRDLVPRGDHALQAGDVLLVEGKRDEILKVKDTAGIDIKAGRQALRSRACRPRTIGLVEAILAARFAAHRANAARAPASGSATGCRCSPSTATARRSATSSARSGCGWATCCSSRDARPILAALEDGNAFRILGAVEDRAPERRAAPASRSAIFAGALVLADASKIVPLPVASLLGAFLDLRDALRHAGGGLPRGRVEGADPDRVHAVARRRHAADREPPSSSRSGIVDRVGTTIPSLAPRRGSSCSPSS